MQKVYLLLRSNKQSGPYTREELLELILKPLDLVWVEGKSFGWSYPSEIESLKNFVEAPTEEKSHFSTQPSQYDKAGTNASSPASNKNIFVSMPLNAAKTFNSSSKPSYNSLEQRSEEVKNDRNHTTPEEPRPDHQALERKADELRQRAQAYASSRPVKNLDDVVDIKYAKTLEEVEEEYTSWMYQKKTNKKNNFSKEQLLSALAVIVVIAGGWFIDSGLFSGETKHKEQVVHVQNSVREENTPVFSEMQEDEKISNDIADFKNQVNKPVDLIPLPEKQLLAENPGKEKSENNVASAPIEDYKLPEPYEKPILQSTEEPVAEVEQPKKKTLGDAVNGVFRKLIKGDEAETKSEPKNGERKSSRRSEVSTAETDISDQIEIKKNNTSDNWMMGVIGLKLTLYNRSSIPLKTAEIEVLYYNDQDRLLEKKRLTFSNVAPKKSQTISAPDHRLADHAEFKIISATGVQDAYAKH
ncbi:MAG: hypothetical protein H0V91_01180 [Flavisolibacter sp.]|nr:hypothetical protein [Flavisolibacter sp.]